MEIFMFSDINSVLLPIGVFGILVAVWKFGFGYEREGLLQLFMPKRAFDVYSIINKFFGFIGYVVFGLILLAGVWFSIAVVNTLVQNFISDVNIPMPLVVFCFVVIFIVVITLVLMIWRYRRNKKGEPHPASLEKQNIPYGDKAATIRRLLNILEQNNKIITDILDSLKDKQNNENNEKTRYKQGVK